MWSAIGSIIFHALDKTFVFLSEGWRYLRSGDVAAWVVVAAIILFGFAVLSVIFNLIALGVRTMRAAEDGGHKEVTFRRSAGTLIEVHSESLNDDYKPWRSNDAIRLEFKDKQNGRSNLHGLLAKKTAEGAKGFIALPKKLFDQAFGKEINEAKAEVRVRPDVSFWTSAAPAVASLRTSLITTVFGGLIGLLTAHVYYVVGGNENNDQFSAMKSNVDNGFQTAQTEMKVIGTNLTDVRGGVDSLVQASTKTAKRSAKDGCHGETATCKQMSNLAGSSIASQ